MTDEQGTCNCVNICEQLWNVAPSFSRKTYFAFGMVFIVYHLLSNQYLFQQTGFGFRLLIFLPYIPQFEIMTCNIIIDTL